MSKYTCAIETPDRLSAVSDKKTEEQGYLQTLEQITTRHPDVCSYAYIRAIHEFFLPLEQNPSARAFLEHQLKSDVRWDNDIVVGFCDDSTAAVDFTIYYCLALYYKRKEIAEDVVPSLESLVQCYGTLFQDFILSYEIRAWHARRINLLDVAYQYDKYLLQKLDIDVNAGVYNSFASTVSARLEKEYKGRCSGVSVSCWKNNKDRFRDWRQALAYMPQIIENWKMVWEDENGYGKHHFIYGKLLMFAPDMDYLYMEERHKRFEKAKKLFKIAMACEKSDEADYSSRKNKYDSYQHDCDIYEAEWAKRPTLAPVLHPVSEILTIKNNREEITKPNEDALVNEPDKGIFLIADGVTRPHEEYPSESDSLAARCAFELCQSVYNYLHNTPWIDPGKALLDAMLEGNRTIASLRLGSGSKYKPAATFLGAILDGNRLYFSNCCDTVGYLIRDNRKLLFTEHSNHLAEILKYSKDTIYTELHNNIHHAAGFGIFNGDDRIKDFLTVSHITLEPGDRIILASDGLSQYLHAARASELSRITLDQLFAASEEYDKPPFQKYADDKTCILLDV